MFVLAKKQKSQIQTTQHEPGSKPSISWATCMNRVLEVNPLECPQPSPRLRLTSKCKSDMRIIAFIQDPFEISKIMKSLNISPQLPTPISRAPPLFPDSPVYDPIDDIYDD